MYLKSLGQPFTQVVQVEEAREGGPTVTPTAVSSFIPLVNKLLPLVYFRCESISYV